MLSLVIVLALVGTVISLVGSRRVVELAAVVLTALETLGAAAIAATVLGRGTISDLGGWLAADALSALIVLLTAGLGLAAAVYSVGYIREDLQGRDLDHGAALADVRRYYALFHLFILTMLIVPLTASLGVMWIAIEGTTLASLFLVGFYRTRDALEAAWKYVIVGSVGIALALFGTILVYYAAVPLLGVSYDLRWSTLAPLADRLDPSIMRLAFVFILVGYGTKAGLAPMHTWLPDAHSEAPSPVSSLLSGVLLGSAMYGILRFYSLTAPAVGRADLSLLLIGFGLLSLVVATLFILRQSDYKRLLAYSSIEHMGLIAAGVAFGGPLGIYAALLQLVNHGLAKSLMFFASGQVLLRYGTKEMGHVTGVLRALPASGPLLALGGLALAGAPPFGVFVSELAILAAGLSSGFVLASLVVAACLGIIFVGLVGHLNGMVFGRPPSDVEIGEVPGPGVGAMGFLGLGLLTLGLWIPGPLHDLLTAAAAIVGGGPA